MATYGKLVIALAFFKFKYFCPKPAPFLLRDIMIILYHILIDRISYLRYNYPMLQCTALPKRSIPKRRKISGMDRRHISGRQSACGKNPFFAVQGEQGGKRAKREEERPCTLHMGRQKWRT